MRRSKTNKRFTLFRQAFSILHIIIPRTRQVKSSQNEIWIYQIPKKEPIIYSRLIPTAT